jgi:hypothetical protein
MMPGLEQGFNTGIGRAGIPEYGLILEDFDLGFSGGIPIILMDQQVHCCFTKRPEFQSIIFALQACFIQGERYVCNQGVLVDEDPPCLEEIAFNYQPIMPPCVCVPVILGTVYSLIIHHWPRQNLSHKPILSKQ